MADPRFRDDRDVRDRPLDTSARAAPGQLPTTLAWACLILAAAIYLAAVAGLLADKGTPPLDVGATSTLVVGLLFGLLGLAVARRPA